MALLPTSGQNNNKCMSIMAFKTNAICNQFKKVLRKLLYDQYYVKPAHFLVYQVLIKVSFLNKCLVLVFD